MFIFTLYTEVKTSTNHKKQRSQLESLSPATTSNQNAKIASTNSDKFNKLYSLNSDYIGWIEIENTAINYPILQSKDNYYYLNNDFYKKPSKYGSIFLDYTNKFPNNFNNIFYGHNTKNASMFTDLVKFKDKDFFENNNKIIITDKNTRYEYEVFSVYTIRGFDDPSYLYELNNIELLDSTTKNKYLNILHQKSFFKEKNLDEAPENIITLITCSYEKKNTRTVVHANLISKKKVDL